ncbi:MAG: PTS sugar transporter subunit IIA [Spirochaetales bacterium]|nr:PTS sugar transporter subunit IIA [Spirochaetales bacterium]
MIRFQSILKPSCVAVGVAAADKNAALEAVARVLFSGGGACDMPTLLEGVLAREKLASTGIGEGVAVPHSLSVCTPETVMAVIRLASPVEFAAIDGQPVDLLFLLAGPEDSSGAHLQILSKLARLLHDPAFRTAAREASDAATLAALLYSKD